MRAILVAIVLALSACAAWAQSDARTRALDTKPGLDKQITLTMRAASLREVLDKVEADTGVKLRPDKEIAEDKCTIWVKDKPARDVLKAIAKCFNLGWMEAEVVSSRYLNLCMDREYQKSMAQKQYEDYAAILGQFDQEMKVMADAINSKTRLEIDQQTYATLPRDQQDRLRLRERYTTSSAYGSMVIQYLHLSEIQKKALFAGQDVVISKDAVCKEAKDLYPEVTGFTFWIVRSMSGFLLQGTVQPELPAHDWLLITTALFDDTRFDKTIDAANALLLKDPALAKEPPAVKTASAPSPQQPTKVISGLANYAPLSVPKPGGGSGATPTTMSDGLIPLAEAAGIPLVAQYLSEYAPNDAPAAKSGTIATQIGTLSRMHKFAVEKDGSFVLCRTLLWHRLRDREVPEATIKRWQKAITGLPYPTFEVVAQMGAMSWGQMIGIIANGTRWFGTNELSEVARAQHVLKLYATLTPAQQRSLGEGRPLPVYEMRPDQRHMFMQAFEFKARPSYVKGQDPSWPQTATLELSQPQCNDQGTIFAVSDMRLVGTEPLGKHFLVDTDQGNMRLSPETLYQTVIPQAVKALTDRVIQEHPEISRKSISTYALFYTSFNYRIGEDDNSTQLLYCAPVQ